MTQIQCSSLGDSPWVIEGLVLSNRNSTNTKAMTQIQCSSLRGSPWVIEGLVLPTQYPYQLVHVVVLEWCPLVPLLLVTLHDCFLKLMAVFLKCFDVAVMKDLV